MPVRSIVPGDAVAVLGAGNMGSGIAQAFAQAGYAVRLRDVNDAMLERGRTMMGRMLDGAVQRGKLSSDARAELLKRIEFTTDVGRAVAGTRLVVEAIFEDEQQKRQLFREVTPRLPDDAIVATNTSSLSVAQLAQEFSDPKRFAGLHFFYPAQVNRLLEVVGGDSTDPAVLEELDRVGYRLRKIPIRVQDRAGFAVNRFFVPFLNESTRLAEENVAPLETIEKVGRELFGATLGPFELMNVTGIPIAVHSEESLERAFGAPYAPSALIRSQLAKGEPWPWKGTGLRPEAEAAVRDRLLGLVLGIAARLVEEGVATPEAVDRGATVGLRWQKGPFGLLSDVGPAEAFACVERYAKRWGDGFPVSAELRARATRGDPDWPLSLVRVERRGSVAWVLLDRPEVLNSLNSVVLGQLERAFAGLTDDPHVRCVVLAGAAPVFAAGADIAEMARKSVAEGRAFGFAGQAVCRRIAEFPHPVIALVEGYALGGGLEIALAADFIVAAEGAQLGLPEATVGIHPGFGGASRLTRLIGPARAKLVIFTSQSFSATEAARLGFVSQVVPADTAREKVQAMAEAIASRAPLALAWVKSVVNHATDGSLEASLHLEGESAGHTFATQDRMEGMTAFLERRPPKFQGR